MAKVKAKSSTSGTWVKVPCTQCGKDFPYFKTYHVVRKFCELCAEKRITKSKQNFEEEKKKGVSRTPEDAEAFRILKQIPDAVNWNSILNRVASLS